MEPTTNYFVSPYKNIKLFKQFNEKSDISLKELSVHFRHTLPAFALLDDRDETLIDEVNDRYVDDTNLRRMLMQRYDIDLDPGVSVTQFLNLVVLWNQMVFGSYTLDRLDAFLKCVARLQIDGAIEDVDNTVGISWFPTTTFNNYYKTPIFRYGTYKGHYNKKLTQSLFRLVRRCIPADLTLRFYYEPYNTFGELRKGIASYGITVRQLREGNIPGINPDRNNKVIDLWFDTDWATIKPDLELEELDDFSINMTGDKND